MHICIAITLSLFSLNGLVYWVPAFFIRLHDMSLADVGFWSAVTFGLGNAAGMFVSGFVVRPLMERDSRWELWFAGLAYAMSAPLYLAAFLALDTTLSISFMCLATFVAAMGLPPGMSALQRVVESDLRATAIGIITFIAAIVSQGFAVFLIGYLSDILAPTLLESSLKVALSITLIFPAWSVVHYVLAARTLGQDDLMELVPDAEVA